MAEVPKIDVFVSLEYKPYPTDLRPCYVCKDPIYSSNMYRIIIVGRVTGRDPKRSGTNITLCESCKMVLAG